MTKLKPKDLPRQDSDTASGLKGTAMWAESTVHSPAAEEAAPKDQTATEEPNLASSEPDPDTAPCSAAFAPGEVVDRYVVEGFLGQGGMGVVLLAKDPDLDRRVALKVLKPRAEGARPFDAEDRARLIREARAMAQLSHPNVITVHDVGSLGDQVFVVMEHIDGGTLLDWLSHPWRSVDETLALFEKAGQGLVAAHEAGLVHRDFKPTNVLVGRDGRVVVADFGLVAGSAFPLALTMTGSIMGTPAYMAPEQHTGQKNIGPKADQFSFCVSLYQALYGRRPFRGKKVAELARNVLNGRVRPPPADSHVPGYLWEPIRRGLLVQPKERHPSMAELLSALEPKRPRGNDQPHVPVDDLLFLGAHRANQGDYRGAQEALGQAIKQVDEGKDPVREADGLIILASVQKAQGQARHALRTIQKAESALASVRGNELMLARALKVKGDAHEALGQHGEAFAQRRACATLFESVGLTESSEHLAILSDLASSLFRAGRLVEAQAAFEQARETALRIGGEHQPHLVQIHFGLAVIHITQGLHQDALTALDRALAVAVRVCPPQDPSLGNIHTWLGKVLCELQRPQEAREHFAAALDLVRRQSEGTVAEGELLARLSSVSNYLGEHEKAWQWAEQGAAVFSALVGPDHLATSGCYIQMGDAARLRGDNQEALPLYERASACREAAGAPADGLAETYNLMAMTLIPLDERPEAAGYFRQTISLKDKLPGKHRAHIAWALTGLGLIHGIEGEQQIALEHFQGALDINEELLAEGHPDLADTQRHVGEALVLLERPDEAIPYLEKARAVLKDAPLAYLEAFASTLLRLGEALCLLRRFGAARAAFEHCLEQAGQLRYIPSEAGALFGLAQTLWAMGERTSHAVTLAEKALALYRGQGERHKKQGALVEAWLDSHPMSNDTDKTDG